MPTRVAAEPGGLGRCVRGFCSQRMRDAGLCARSDPDRRAQTCISAGGGGASPRTPRCGRWGRPARFFAFFARCELTRINSVCPPIPVPKPSAPGIGAGPELPVLFIGSRPTGPAARPQPARKASVRAPIISLAELAHNISMPIHTRAKTKSQQRHAASRSQSHRQDKAQGEARRQTAWIGVEAPARPSPRRSFGPLLQGHEYRRDGEHWRRCQDPEEFADYIEAEAARRAWYLSRTTRRGVAVTMKRPVATPVTVQTTTFAPWLSDWTAAQVAAGHDPRPQLAGIRNGWLRTAETALAGRRHVLGYAFHADTDDLHFDLLLTREDGEGGRIGEPGLKLVGPWCVAVDRQVRSGAELHPEKREQLQRSVANFRHRYGDTAKPLDVVLARALDTAADEILGEELAPYRLAYARRVPELERLHAQAALAAVNAASARLRERATPRPLARRPAPVPTPEPDLPPLG
jgi:hypothetical protein